ncbi:MAG TPA: phosphoglycerate kinase [Terriglobales bacterium]|nr:phosphoglycerate kinase [Terriglobales bacterium]
MAKLSITQLDLNKKRVFLRADFNVPLSDEGKITDDTRIRETLPTIQYALRNGARVFAASHLGRPKGKPNSKMSLKPVAERLWKLLREQKSEAEVSFASDCVGAEAEQMAADLAPGQVLLLENLRFHPEEEANDEKFSQALARLADYYVNDAFGTAHRAHASTVGITHFVEKSAAGFLMQKELTYLGKALEDPQRPFVAILGGAKVSDKIEVIRNLMGKVDTLLIGGSMAFTFLKASGSAVGKSLVEEDKVELARKLLDEAGLRHLKLLLPVDHVIADKIAADAQVSVLAEGSPIPDDRMGLDIGPKTVALFAAEIAAAKTIVWNGPMGVFELAPFAEGTIKIAKAIAANSSCTSIVGGGDSVAAVHMAGVAEQITHISTGGGASLEFLEGKKLPGVEALTDST